MRATLAALLAAAALAGCSSDDDPVCDDNGVCYEPAALACNDITPTVDRGVYGCVRYFDDSSGLVTAQAGYPMELYTDVGQAEPVGAAVSDDRGFYQIAVERGTYRFCASWNHAACSEPFTVPATPHAIDFTIDSFPRWDPR